MSQKSTVVALLADAGVVVGGSEPWDMQVHDERLWNRFLAEGTLGLGEAYMDGWWDCADLAEFFNRTITKTVDRNFRPSLNLIWLTLQARLLNMQTIARSRRVAKMHYNETQAYQATLDTRMTGSCGYWPDGVADIDQAQEAKLDLVCRKIGIKPGQKIWDIGCGWGAFMGFAAANYGADCVGVTVSPEQAAYGCVRYKHLPVEFQVEDYREFTGKVDHVVSMGMFEHVGHKNYRSFFQAARRAMADDGLFLLHTVGSTRSNPAIDPWLNKYIFPGGAIPSMAQIGTAIDGIFAAIDVQNIGPHYDKTLVAWSQNFAVRWPRTGEAQNERFYRMWQYYLLCCAGGFRSRMLHVWQLVLSTNGVPEGYLTQR